MGFVPRELTKGGLVLFSQGGGGLRGQWAQGKEEVGPGYGSVRDGGEFEGPFVHGDPLLRGGH